MKKLIQTLTFSSLLAITTVTNAAQINIPSGCFQGTTTNINYPLFGTANAGVGAWNLQLGGVLSLLGSVKVGTATAIGGPAPLTGTNELGVSMPVNALAGFTMSQTLSNYWLPNSTYTFSVDISPAGGLGLLSGATLALQAGSSNVVSVSSNALVSLFLGSTAFHTVTMTVKTTSKVPNSPVGLYLSTPNVAAAVGSFYVDNFTLSVVPNNVVFTMTNNSPNLTFSGSGAAPNQNFELITTTNLLTPTPSWSKLNTSTSQFDANGNFQLNVPIDYTINARFFRLVLQ